MRLDTNKLCQYSGTLPYGHLTSKVTSPHHLLSPKLYSTVQKLGCWPLKVTCSDPWVTVTVRFHCTSQLEGW